MIKRIWLALNGNKFAQARLLHMFEIRGRKELEGYENHIIVNTEPHSVVFTSEEDIDKLRKAGM